MKQIQIIGERCSGTNWLGKLVTLNFECSLIEHGKHFRYPQWPGLPDPVPDLTLVILRDRISWLQSFHQLPHHVPEAVGVTFEKFIRMRIRSYLGPKWERFYSNRWARRLLMRPEWLREDHANPMELRADKLRYYLSLREIFPTPVIYLTMEGLQAEIGKIAELVECPQRSESVLPVTDYKGDPIKGEYRPTVYPAISAADRQWIDEQTDFEMEDRYRAICEI